MKVEIEINRYVYDKSDTYRKVVADMLEAKIQNNQRVKYLSTRKMQAIEAFYQRPDYERIYGARSFVKDHVRGTWYAEIRSNDGDRYDPADGLSCSIRILANGISEKDVYKEIRDELRLGLRLLNREGRLWHVFTCTRTVAGHGKPVENWLDVRMFRVGDRIEGVTGWEEVTPE